MDLARGPRVGRFPKGGGGTPSSESERDRKVILRAPGNDKGFPLQVSHLGEISGVVVGACGPLEQDDFRLSGL